MTRPGGTLQLDQQVDQQVVRAGQGSGAQSAVQGGWFADPTPGVDALGREVSCRGCRAGLSQPRIDYGLTWCPGCRPVPPVGDGIPWTASTVRVRS